MRSARICYVEYEGDATRRVGGFVQVLFTSLGALSARHLLTLRYRGVAIARFGDPAKTPGGFWSGRRNPFFGEVLNWKPISPTHRPWHVDHVPASKILRSHP